MCKKQKAKKLLMFVLFLAMVMAVISTPAYAAADVPDITGAYHYEKMSPMGDIKDTYDVTFNEDGTWKVVFFANGDKTLTGKSYEAKYDDAGKLVVTIGKINEDALPKPGTDLFYDDTTCDWYLDLDAKAITSCHPEGAQSTVTYNNVAHEVKVVADKDSVTGYTATITVKDNGYHNVYAYATWVCYAMGDNETAYSPHKWKNGMYYNGNSQIAMTLGDDGYWTVSLPLTSDVMQCECFDLTPDQMAAASRTPL